MIINWGSYVIDWVFTSMDLTAFELFDCVFGDAILVMSSDSTKGDSLETLFHFICKTAFRKTAIVCVVMLNSNASSCTKVLKVMLSLEG